MMFRPGRVLLGVAAVVVFRVPGDEEAGPGAELLAIQPEAQVGLAAAGPAIAGVLQALHELRDVEADVDAFGGQFLLQPARRIEQRLARPDVIVCPGGGASRRMASDAMASLGVRAHRRLLFARAVVGLWLLPPVAEQRGNDRPPQWMADTRQPAIIGHAGHSRCAHRSLHGRLRYALTAAMAGVEMAARRPLHHGHATRQQHNEETKRGRASVDQVLSRRRALGRRAADHAGAADCSTTRWRAGRTARRIDFMGRVLSYREFGALADRAAKGLQTLGVGPGVHVGLYLPNSPHYPIAFFGVLKAGGTVVNYSPLDAERVLEHKVEDSQTDILVTLDLAALYPQMARLLGRSRLKKLVVGSLAEYRRAARGGARAAERPQAAERVPADDQHVSFAQLLDNDGSYQAHPRRRPEGRHRRAAVHRRHDRPAQGRDADACQPVGGLRAVRRKRPSGNPPILAEGSERVLVGAAAVPHLCADRQHAVRRAPGRADWCCTRASTWMRCCRTWRPRRSASSPACRRCTPRSSTTRRHRAGPEVAEVLRLRRRAAAGRGGAALLRSSPAASSNEGWGMTETSPTGTFTPARGMRKAGSCGMPLPGIELEVRGRRQAGPGRGARRAAARCASAGPNVMKGYWKNRGDRRSR